MSKLEDYYRLFDMFKGKLTDEQKAILGGLEDQIITEEILPAISESVAPVLSTLRRKLTLVLDFDPDGGITVKTTRGEVVVKEHTAKKYEIPTSRKIVRVAEADKEKPPIKRSPATGLCVWLPDGTFIQEKKANLTMAKAVEMAGPSAVAKLQIPQDSALLVSKDKHPKYSGEQQKLSGGYLLNTHSSTMAKKAILDKISTLLHLGWKVEII